MKFIGAEEKERQQGRREVRRGERRRTEEGREKRKYVTKEGQERSRLNLNSE
jgi:hypothetical protein